MFEKTNEIKVKLQFIIIAFNFVVSEFNRYSSSDNNILFNSGTMKFISTKSINNTFEINSP